MRKHEVVSCIWLKEFHLSDNLFTFDLFDSGTFSNLKKISWVDQNSSIKKLNQLKKVHELMEIVQNF